MISKIDLWVFLLFTGRNFLFFRQGELIPKRCLTNLNPWFYSEHMVYMTWNRKSISDWKVEMKEWFDGTLGVLDTWELRSEHKYIKCSFYSLMFINERNRCPFQNREWGLLCLEELSSVWDWLDFQDERKRWWVMRKVVFSKEEVEIACRKKNDEGMASSFYYSFLKNCSFR